MSKFDLSDTKAFLQRPWHVLEDANLEHWKTVSPSKKLQIASELRRRAMEASDDWPSAADRQADLEHHIELSRLFRKASCDEPHASGRGGSSR